jgi:hypothetical protein
MVLQTGSGIEVGMTMHDVIFHLVARTRFRWTGIDTRERAGKAMPRRLELCGRAFPPVLPAGPSRKSGRTRRPGSWESLIFLEPRGASLSRRAGLPVRELGATLWNLS